MEEVGEVGKSAADCTFTTRTPSGINIATGSAAVVITAAFAAIAFPAVTARLAVMVLAVAGYATVVTDTGASTAVAAVAYLLFNGFLVNRHGELTWDDTTSIWHIAMFFFAVLLGLARKWLHYARVRAAVAAELDELVNTPTSKR